MAYLSEMVRKSKEKFDKRHKKIMNRKTAKDDGNNHYITRFIKQAEKEKVQDEN